MPIALLARRTKEINRVVLIPLSEIVSSPYQPRKHFDESALQELSRSIVANGLLQPISVRKLPNEQYELIAGERRTLAFRMLGRESIPAIVEEYSDQQSAVLSLIENLQRKDLNFFEEAEGIARLMEQLNLTQQQVSTRLGKAQSTVANKLRLLRYPRELQQKMLEAGLSERHARALLKISDPVLLETAVNEIITHGFNVEQTEGYIERLLQPEIAQKRTRLFVVKDMRMFQNTIHKACSLMNLAGIPVEQKKQETDDYIEYQIRIPKEMVYRSREQVCSDSGAG